MRRTKGNAARPGPTSAVQKDRSSSRPQDTDRALSSGSPVDRMLFLQRTAGNQAVESVRHAIGTPGRPLDLRTRELMESRFGRDLSQVRVHTDAEAAESASTMHAQAYTVGQDVVFGEGEYAPDTTAGRRLLAHELAHTIQQRGVTGPPPSNHPLGRHETAARAAAQNVASGRPAPTPMPSGGIGVSMSPEDDRAKAVAEAEAVLERMASEEKQAATDEQREDAERQRKVPGRPTTLSLLHHDPRFYESLRISGEMDAQVKERREREAAEDAERIKQRADAHVAKARNDAYRRHVKAPARQYGRDFGVVGGPTIMVAKVAGDAFAKLEPVIPPELSASVLPGALLLTHNSRRLKEVEAEIAAEKDRRDMLGEAQTAHAHGELFQLPVVVASTEKIDESASPDPMVAAGTTTKEGKPARSPARVEAFIRDITTIYRQEIAAARRENPTGTASSHGTVAERRTLAQVDAVARTRGLNPGHIWVGNFPVGVTGPRGGVVSAEMGSPHYGFIVELKKSPRAVGGLQAEAHLVAVQNSLNFPNRGIYTRIYGEGYKGAGVDRQKMGTELDKQKAERKRGPRIRVR